MVWARTKVLSKMRARNGSSGDSHKLSAVDCIASGYPYARSYDDHDDIFISDLMNVFYSCAHWAHPGLFLVSLPFINQNERALWSERR